MADDLKASRSIGDEMVDGIMNSVVTPAEIFFFALFVFGVLSLAATTLVGVCGDIDDFDPVLTERNTEYVPGAAVVLTHSVALDDIVVGAGTCGVIERIDEEGETAYIHILAKAQPFLPVIRRDISHSPVFQTFLRHRYQPSSFCIKEHQKEMCHCTNYLL